MSKFNISTKGTMKFSQNGSYLGIKVPSVAQFMQNPEELYRTMTTGLKKQQIQKDLNTIFRARIKKRIPDLRKRLKIGYKRRQGEGISGPHTAVMGTVEFENTSHGSHEKHIDIPDIWSRLVGPKALGISVTGTGMNIKVKTKFSETRNKYIKFYNIGVDSMMNSKVSTIVKRLDATCLPFLKSGLFDNILKFWGEYSCFTLARGVRLYFQDREKALKDL